jgi:hypothetical protein
MSKYIASLGTNIQNHQKFLGYYKELYEFYKDQMPDNKYIYYLDENPFKAPAVATTSEVFKFFSATPLQLSLLTPSIQIYKVFQTKKAEKKVVIPFENRMDFESFKDPLSYIGGDPPFISERFMGPVVGLKNLNISY